jgi:LPXTG-motif cell wall-anchored protein
VPTTVVPTTVVPTTTTAASSLPSPASSPRTPTGAVDDGTLARTGARQIESLVVLGSILVMGGAILLGWHRRRTLGDLRGGRR